MSSFESRVTAQIALRNRVICPHCWSAYSPEQTLYVAQHPDLVGDPRLGKDHAVRFLPTRFTVEGAALDARGFSCHALACPKCHLPVPRVFYEMPPSFFSILGAPACGKSYFLAAMTWRLRKVFPKYFQLSLADADPLSNHRLHEYESLQFLNPDPQALVRIEKTETQGDQYDTVLFGDHAINYPRPFMFTLTPLATHPNVAAAAKVNRAVCLYDNAGESFLPGQDTATSPVTRHLSQSKALFFLFDPTQDVRFRKACQGRSEDPQMALRSERSQRESAVRQETILQEAAQRVRRYTGLSQQAKFTRPLVVVVTKCDTWAPLLGKDELRRSWTRSPSSPMCAMDLQYVQGISQKVRSILWALTPEVVTAAEGFARQVVYIPVSATGCSPETDAATGNSGFRPASIAPIWVEVPLLFVLSRWMEGMVPYTLPSSRGSGNNDGKSPSAAAEGAV